MPEVIRINPAMSVTAVKNLRVCAYCRVSSNSADQQNSYSVQINYYTRYIQSRNDWDFVEIFADEGITGTSTDKRTEFQRMIQLCEHHQIDLIITKSISRFARNVPDCLEHARRLKRMGIGIIFEKESINTLRMSDELMLSTFSAIAQEESVAISQRLRHMNHERMKRGEYVAGTCPFGYRLEGKKLTVFEPEAEYVRQIFDAYLNGRSVGEIARDLREQQVAKRTGDTRWHYYTVYYILTNEKYMGDTLFQKTFKTDTLPFKKRKNNGELDQYYATGSHDPIIGRDAFQTTQKLLKERGEYFGRANKQGNYPLTRKIRCTECGAFFVRKVCKDSVIWSCLNHIRNKNLCPAKRYSEQAIYDSFIRMFNKLYLHDRQILRFALEQFEYTVTFKKKNDSQAIEYNRQLSELLEKKHMLEQLRRKGYLADAVYLNQTKEIDSTIQKLKEERLRLFDTGLETAYSEIKDLAETVESRTGPLTEFDEDLFQDIVQKIDISPSGEITFTLAGGLKFTERL
jgi:site-specific DNA recombinase